MSQSLLASVGFQVSAVLAAPQGGVALELVNPVTEVTEVIILSREAAQTLYEQFGATLRCNPLDQHVGAADRLEQWHRDQAARPLVSVRCPRASCHRGFRVQLDDDGFAQCPDCTEEFNPLQLPEASRPAAPTLSQRVAGLFTVFSSKAQTSPAEVLR